MKIVLDTNVLVSGLLSPGGSPGRILAAWDAGRFDLAICQEQLEELSRVLDYPKIRHRLASRKIAVDALLEQLLLRCVSVVIADHPEKVSRDPDDDYLIALLVASEAEVLVSGDGDLLALHETYPVLAPEEFAARL